MTTFLAEREPIMIRTNPPLDLRTLAAELQILPVCLDMGGCYALRLNGELVSFAWDDPSAVQEEIDERIRNLALYQGSLKYPVLRSLVPSRPPAALVCSTCNGTGKVPPDLPENIICFCGGLGWLPPKVG